MTADRRGSCGRVLAQIESYVDGELDAVECDVIEGHCQQCAPCAAIVRGLRQTIGMCRDAGRAPLPAPIRERARDQVRRLLAKSRIP
jgi:anti-sigma factor RsiW